MKVVALCFQLFILAVAQEYYDRRYDYFDIDYLIQNQRLLKKYMNCFLDKGPCPPIGRVFKNLLPEVVMTRCAKCSPRQRGFAQKAVGAFERYLPADHAELKKKLDPNNQYYDAFVESLTTA